VNELQKRFLVFVGVKESDGKKLFEALPMLQDVCVLSDKSSTATLKRRVDVKCVASILRAEDLTDLAQVLRAVMLIPRITIFIPAYIEVAPPSLRRHSQGLEVLAPRVRIIGKMQEFDDALALQRDEVREQSPMLTVNSHHCGKDTAAE